MKIAVFGLGYVGLPLAMALARKFQVIGFDVDLERVGELKAGYDRTREVAQDALIGSSITLSSEPETCRGVDVYIVAVPTPVDRQNRPDPSGLGCHCCLTAAQFFVHPFQRADAVLRGESLLLLQLLQAADLLTKNALLLRSDARCCE